MQFDPAIAAHTAFQRSQERHELGSDAETAATWQAEFGSTVGAEATAAYRRLLTLGERHPSARAFQEFLIYSTWQQAAEDPVPEHFQQGVALCERFLADAEGADARTLAQVRAIRLSFLSALGMNQSDEVSDEYDRDAFKGGD